jgi:hypothetical protein
MGRAIRFEGVGRPGLVHVGDRNYQFEVELAVGWDVNDGDLPCRPSVVDDLATPKELGDGLKRSLRGREPDSLRRLVSDLLEPFQGQGKVGSSLRACHGVNFVNDHPLDRPQSRSDRGCEHEIEGLRSGNENVWWVALHPPSILLRGVPGSEKGGQFRRGIAAETLGGVSDACQRGAQVSVDVVRQSFERRDVEHPTSTFILW